MTSAAIISDAVVATFLQAAAVLKPPPKLSISEWAERERILSSESSSEVGRYRVARAPYQKAMMDAVLLPGVEEVVFFTGAQLGKSLCMENIFGYFACEDPCPVIWMWPDEGTAKEWSGDTLGPFLSDTPALKALFDENQRKNRALFKKFPGGWLAIIGAKAPAGLRRRRARVVLADELDAYDASAGKEGDPIELVAQRSVTFFNAVRILASTGVDKGDSRIEARYENTNKQKYWVRCPHCDEAQLLQWSRVIYPKDEEPTTENTCYACEGCGVELTELDKPAMLVRGEWRAERPDIVKRQGFWISGLYSPFESWAQQAARWKNAMAHRENPNLLKTFVNLVLGETYEDRDHKVDKNELIKRVETYPVGPFNTPLLPDGVVVLTAGCDVQPDRIELELVGWGRGEESWSIDVRTFDGNTAQLPVWEQLDEYLLREWTHLRGPRLEVAATFIDSGFHANEVYAFTKSRWERRVFACKGSSTFSHPPLGKASRTNRARVRLYPVGTSQIKKLIYRRLAIDVVGPGYMHFSHCNDAEYFNQLTVEQLKKKYEHGFPVHFWEKAVGARNEAMDCRVYAYAAFLSLSEAPARMLEALKDQLTQRAKAQRGADPKQLNLVEQPVAPPPEDEPTGEAEAVPEWTEQFPVEPPPAPVTPPAPQVVEEPAQRFVVRRPNWATQY